MTTLLTVVLFTIWPFSNEKIKEEIEAMHSEAKFHFKTNPDSAISLVNIALIKSEEANYDYGAAKSLYLLGSAANKQGKPALSTTHFLKALEVYSRMEDSRSWSDQANIYLSLNDIFRKHHKLKESLELSEKGIEFALKADNNKVLIRTLHNSAMIYKESKDYTRATSLLNQAMENIKPDNQKDKLKTFNELGVVLFNQKKYDEAEVWFSKTIDIAIEENAHEYLGIALHNLANIAREKGDYLLAWQLFQQAVELFDFEGLTHHRFLNFQDMAKLAQLEGNQEQALIYANEAIQMLDKLPNRPEYFSLYGTLSECTKDTNKALAYRVLQVKGFELFQQTQEQLIAKLEGYKLDVVIAHHQNELLQKNQTHRTFWMLSCGLFFLLVAVYLFLKVWRVYSYRSPQASLALIKNPNEMLYLLDIFRNEKEEYKKLIRQKKKKVSLLNK